MTYSVHIAIPDKHNQVFGFGTEQGQEYLKMHKEVWGWLDSRDLSWEMEERIDTMEFIFPSRDLALLFKLTWGGK